MCGTSVSGSNTNSLEHNPRSAHSSCLAVSKFTMIRCQFRRIILVLFFFRGTLHDPLIVPMDP